MKNFQSSFQLYFLNVNFFLLYKTNKRKKNVFFHKVKLFCLIFFKFFLLNIPPKHILFWIRQIWEPTQKKAKIKNYKNLIVRMMYFQKQKKPTDFSPTIYEKIQTFFILHIYLICTSFSNNCMKTNIYIYQTFCSTNI